MSIKRIFSTCLFVLSFLPVANGQVSINELMKLRPISVGIHPTPKSANIIYLEMGFSRAKFIEELTANKLPVANQIQAIHLVYTRYRQVDSFNQPELHRTRFAELQAVFPSIFEESSIEWRIFEQRKPVTEDDARQAFHGFVVYLKNPPNEAEVEKELKRIEAVLETYRDTSTWVPEKTVYRTKRHLEPTGFYLPHNNSKKLQGMRFESAGIWMRKPEMKVVVDSIPLKKIPGHYRKDGIFDSSLLARTTEYRSLTSKAWNGRWTIIADVTGSMSPYNAQVMLWLRYSTQALEMGRFCFFNDGDSKPQELKFVGRTGGLYFAESQDFDSVYRTMAIAMKNGMGGDYPENNIEATLYSLKRWPDTDSVLMIADNNAPIKDISLMQHVDKPICIMLCGVHDQIHLDYIELARKTGGSLLVNGTELRNLQVLRTGSKVKIGRHWFIYQSDGLKRIGS